MIPKVKIAEDTLKIIAGTRAVTHGDAYENHTKIAAVWNGILEAAGKSTKQPLNAHDVANLMEGLKIARRYLGDFNVDDYIDGAGYAACAGEIASRQNEIAASWVEKAIETSANFVADRQAQVKAATENYVREEKI